MNSLPTRQITLRRLMRLGVILFILGLFTGLSIPMLTNPRMGLSSHLEGVMNGTFLIVLGLICNKFRLSRMTMQITFWLVIYGTYINWATILAAAVWGAGNSMMPIAARIHACAFRAEIQRRICTQATSDFSLPPTSSALSRSSW